MGLSPEQLVLLFVEYLDKVSTSVNKADRLKIRTMKENIMKAISNHGSVNFIHGLMHELERWISEEIGE